MAGSVRQSTIGIPNDVKTGRNSDTVTYNAHFTAFIRADLLSEAYKNLPSNYAKPANPAATNAAFARTMVNILFGWKRENDKAHELRTIYPIVDHSDYNWYPQMKDGEVLGDTTKPEDLDEDKKQPYVVVEHHALVGNVVHDKPMMASFRRLESTGLTATSVSANTVRSDRPSAIVKKTEETISVVDKGNDTKAETASKQETAAHPTISQPL